MLKGREPFRRPAIKRAVAGEPRSLPASDKLRERHFIVADCKCSFGIYSRGAACASLPHRIIKRATAVSCKAMRIEHRCPGKDQRACLYLFAADNRTQLREI